MKQHGGKSIYGATVGILMLDARFPRIPGDTGHAGTWRFPVLYRVVRGASPDLVVRRRAVGVLPDFIAAARDLVADGADGITTNCGFLSLFQDELAAAVGVPVAASTLMQAPLLQATLPPGKRVGVITINRETLSDDHLQAAGVALDTPIVGTEGGRELSRVILDDEPELDVAAATQDMLDAAATLCGEHPDVGAILFECTNMAPYAAAVRRATGLPVVSMVSFINWFHGALMPPQFAAEIDDPRH